MLKRVLVRLYPRAWRRRYGPEFAALLARQPLTPREVCDVVAGALDAHWRAWSRRLTRMCGALVLARERSNQRGKEQDMARLQTYHCSFCGKKQDQVQRLIAGPHGVYICDECIALCNEILAEDVPPMVAGQANAHHAATRRGEAPWWRRVMERWHRAARPAPGLV